MINEGRRKYLRNNTIWRLTDSYDCLNGIFRLLNIPERTNPSYDLILKTAQKTRGHLDDIIENATELHILAETELNLMVMKPIDPAVADSPPKKIDNVPETLLGGGTRRRGENGK